MAQANKICKICNELGHSKFYCRNKPFKPITKVSKKRLENPKPPKPPKPINKVGKKGKAWIDTKKEWKKANPPDDAGLWYCKVGGHSLSDGSSYLEYTYNLNLCHDYSRARRPDLANDLNNIFAGCPLHNREQGSMNLDEYLSKEHSERCGNM